MNVVSLVDKSMNKYYNAKFENEWDYISRLLSWREDTYTHTYIQFVIESSDKQAIITIQHEYMYNTFKYLHYNKKKIHIDFVQLKS